MTPNPDPLSASQSPTTDAETLAFFQAVFELARAGDAEQLAPLLEKGLPANVKKHKGDLEMVKLLLAHRADTETLGAAGKTALMMAAMFNRFESIDLLLASGANLQMRDVDGLSVVDAVKLMGAHEAAARLEAQLAQTHPAQQF